MNYIMSEPHVLLCSFFDRCTITHYNRCCSQGCSLDLNFNYPHKKELYKELKIKIDTKDIIWALQNLQSNNKNKLIVANYLVKNYHELY